MPFLLLIHWACLWGVFCRSPLTPSAYRKGALGMGAAIWLCMGGQLLLLWRADTLTAAAALPFHLCSFCGFITLPALMKKYRPLWEMMLFLGLPGALGALLFPCPAESPWQDLMNFCFLSLHCLLVIAPLLPLGVGMRPSRHPRGALLWANALLLMAALANRLFDANFLFLRWAPPGTPLAFFHRWGAPGYVMWLEGLAVLLLWRPWRKKTAFS